MGSNTVDGDESLPRNLDLDLLRLRMYR